MITIDCKYCCLWHSPDLDCRTDNMDGRSWLCKPPIDDPVPLVITPIDPPSYSAGPPEPIVGTIKLKRKYERKAK